MNEIILDELAEVKRIVQELKDALLDKNGVNVEEYLRVERTAAFLDCARDHIYNAIKKRVPYISRGTRIYFALPDLHKYMESGKRFPKNR